MPGRTRVLVVGTDRALRANLASLLRLEYDLAVEDCSSREAGLTAAQMRPEVVIMCGPSPGSDRLADRQIYLTDRTPYENVLRAIRGEETQSFDNPSSSDRGGTFF